jgi:hypothetical protein
VETSFPAERQQVELRNAEVILWFDGSVLEIFSGYARQGGGSQYENSMRIHVKQLRVELKGPDRKDRRKVTFEGPAYGFPFEFEQAEWNEVEPLLDTLRSAGAEFS